MSNIAKNPPKFSSSKNYDRYKKELIAWTKITKVEKAEWANTIALGLPEDDPSNIRDKVFETINLDGEAGFTALETFMDKEFKKDDIVDMCEHIRTFMKFQKTKEMTMQMYISNFESAYTSARNKGLPEMPKSYLMYQILENANLNDRDYRFVLSDIDFAAADPYKLATKALMKYFGSVRPTNDHHECVELKVEDSDAFYQKNNYNPNFKSKYPLNTWKNPRQNPFRNSSNSFRKPQDNSSGSKPLNPSRDGQIMLCNSCGSYRHLLKDCPHKHGAPAFFTQDQNYDEQEEDEIQEDSNPADIHFTGFGLYDVLATNLDIYTSENIEDDITNCVLIDTGCVKTVAGLTWFKNFTESKSKLTRERIVSYPSDKQFRFGGNDVKKSLGWFQIPCSLNGKNIILQTDVIEADIPCLLSKEIFKKAGGKIDFVKDVITLYGMEVKLKSARSGHYVIPLQDFIHSDETKNLVFLTNLGDPEGCPEKQIEKLHKAMGHPARHTLEKMIQNANCNVPNLSNILSKLYSSCLTCLKFHKSLHKPKVSPPLANDFNHTIGMDLKVWPKYKVIILYIIDHYTRYSQAHIIPDKKADTIIEKLLDGWILSLFGAPKNIMIDNGGEFYNQKFKDVCQNLNIKIMATAAESPFQNGLVERNHSITDNIVEKMIMDNPKLSIKKALRAANFAKNSLINVHGYSPIQLVTGKLPNLPSVMTNLLPAQECSSGVEAYSDRINAIYSARKAFIEIENSQRINRALKTKINPTFEIYEPGDEVYYKKGDKTIWEGPARVIGVDGKVICIKHGRFIHTTSQSRLIKTTSAIYDGPHANQAGSGCQNDVTNAPKRTVNREIKSGQDLDSDDSDDEHEEHGEILQNLENHRLDEPVVQQNSEEQQVDDLPIDDQEIDAQQGIDDQSEESREVNVEVDENSLVEGESRELTMPDKPTTYPKRNQWIIFKDDDGVWRHVQVLQKIYNNSHNMGRYYKIMSEGKPDGLYIDAVEWYYAGPTPAKKGQDSVIHYLTDWCDLTQPQDILVIFVPRAKWNTFEVKEAMKKELKNFENFEVYKLVDDIGQDFISSGWVITEKVKNDQTYIKARLVIHGNQEEEPPRTDSPTVKKTSLRIQFTLAAQNDWVLHSADVTAAFLQAQKLNREILVKPPKQADMEGKLWYLLKPMYGLGDASRLWYLTIKDHLLEAGCKMLDTDQAVFYYHHEDKLHGMLTMHVDDIQYCGTEQFDKNIIQPLKEKFKFGDFQRGEFKCLGWQVKHEDDDIIVDQNDYIKNKLDLLDIVTYGVDPNLELDQEEVSQLRKVVGKLRWAADQTRIDIAYYVLMLSTIMNKATIKDVKVANKAIKVLKSTELPLRFVKLTGDTWYITVYSDASFKNLPDGVNSAMGYVILLSNGYEFNERSNCCVLAWKSVTIKRVTNSTYESETLALSEAVEEAMVLKDQLIKLTNIPKELIKIESLCDCRDTVAAIYSTKTTKGGRVQIDIARIQQLVEEGEVERVKWIPTVKQIADSLTKEGAAKESLLSTVINARFFS